MSSKSNVTLHCHIFDYLYIQANKQVFDSLKVLVKVSLVFIIINKLNADQALIQIKRLEKVQHINSAQSSQTDGLSHGRTGCYTLVKMPVCKDYQIYSKILRKIRNVPIMSPPEVATLGLL